MATGIAEASGGFIDRGTIGIATAPIKIPWSPKGQFLMGASLGEIDKEIEASPADVIITHVFLQDISLKEGFHVDDGIQGLIGRLIWAIDKIVILIEGLHLFSFNDVFENGEDVIHVFLDERKLLIPKHIGFDCIIL